MKYYVYELIDPRSLKTFYVGKGKDKRMYSHVSRVKHGKIPNQNKHLYNKIKQILNDGYEVKYKQIFFTNDNDEAFKKETERINQLGLNNLCNSFVSPPTKEEIYKLRSKNRLGCKLTDETKDKIKNSLKGHVVSDETREKISKSKKGKPKPCSDFQKSQIIKAYTPIGGWPDLISPTGKRVSIYSVSDFCKKYNLRTSAICELIHNKHKHHKGWKVYKKIDDGTVSTKWIRDEDKLKVLKEWNKIGFNFEPNYQVKTDGYIFYISGYDKEKNVVLEYDGKYYNSSKNKERNLIKQNKIIEILKPTVFWRYNSINKQYRNILTGE